MKVIDDISNYLKRIDEYLYLNNFTVINLLTKSKRLQFLLIEEFNKLIRLINKFIKTINKESYYFLISILKKTFIRYFNSYQYRIIPNT